MYYFDFALKLDIRNELGDSECYRSVTWILQDARDMMINSILKWNTKQISSLNSEFKLILVLSVTYLQKIKKKDRENTKKTLF